MRQAPVRLVTFLSPALYQTYEYVAHYLGQQLGLTTSLRTGQTLAEFARGEAEIGFLCGLLYVHLQRLPSCPVELLAAPVLLGERYEDRPIYFSDVIVQSFSPYTSFEDLRGCHWAFNELASHSGYNLVQYSLLQRGLPRAYFGQTSATGSHLRSLHAVLTGEAEAAALDSHLLDTLLQQTPELGARLRVIDTLGPSPIPPLVVARSLDPALKQQIREILLDMHLDSQAAQTLARGCIKRFAPVSEADYQRIGAMFDLVQSQSELSARV